MPRATGANYFIVSPYPYLVGPPVVFPASLVLVCLEISIANGGKVCAKDFRCPCGASGKLAHLMLLSVAVASAQGPAPETAPPLFPGGGLVS
jgi:hypothetical protein